MSYLRKKFKSYFSENSLYIFWYTVTRLPRRLYNNFFQKYHLLKAAALSYATVLCLVPLLALSFSVANIALDHLGPDQTNELLDNLIVNTVPQLRLLEHENQVELNQNFEAQFDAMPRIEDIRERVKEVIESVGSGQMGLIGLGFLLFLSVSLVLTMEHIFNDIWGGTSSRSLLSRAALYLVIIVIGLIFLSLAVTLSGQWQHTIVGRQLQQIPYLNPLIGTMTPFVLFWFILTFIYLILPNTKVKFWAAIIGGVVGGSLLQLNSMLSSLYIVNLIMISRIYGSLGILPIFLVGLYASWLIVLLGAELAHSLEEVAEKGQMLFGTPEA